VRRVVTRKGAIEGRATTWRLVRRGRCSLVHNTTHTVGVLLAIYGIAARHDVLVRNDVSLWVAPTSAGSAVGVAANF